MYRSGRVRASGETNGKACNLNNTLKWLYPPEKCVADEEVTASSTVLITQTQVPPTHPAFSMIELRYCTLIGV